MSAYQISDLSKLQASMIVRIIVWCMDLKSTPKAVTTLLSFEHQHTPEIELIAAFIKHTTLLAIKMML